MASVVIAGDTSGTVTLAAPATAGTTTLTLPTTDGTVITTGSTGDVSQAMLATGVAGTGPAFSAFQSSAQTLPTSTATKLLFQTEEFDTNNNFSSSTFTPTVAGYYQINGCVQLATTNTTIYSAIYKNGTEYKIGTVAAGSSAAGVSSLVYLNGSTDYVELYGYFAAGQNAATGTSSTWFNGSLVRAA